MYLNPDKFRVQDQPASDISGKRHAIFSFLFNGKYQKVRFYYHYQDKTHQPFPKHTHGYLYYCTPSPDRPSLSGSFRFRVVTPDERFAEGTDLLRPDGRPWELTLYNAIQTAGYAPLVRQLLNEGLLSADLLDTVDQLPRINVRAPSDVLYTLSDPFKLSLDQAKMLTIVTEDHSVSFRFRPLIDTRLCRLPFTGMLVKLAKKKRRYLCFTFLFLFFTFFFLFQGTVLARFEKSDLPEHAHKRVVVTRVLDILSPVQCLIPDYDFYVQLPASGQLIARRKRTSGYRPWSIDISGESTSTAKCLGLLFPENALSSPLKCEHFPCLEGLSV